MTRYPAGTSPDARGMLQAVASDVLREITDLYLRRLSHDLLYRGLEMTRVQVFRKKEYKGSGLWEVDVR